MAILCNKFPRRRFLATGLGGLAGWTIQSAFAEQGNPEDVGQTLEGRVTFPDETMPTEPAPGSPTNPLPEKERVGFAIVGLGRLSLNNIIPAFSQTKKAKLVALVTGTPEKGSAIAKQYGLKQENLYHYDNFDQIAKNPAIQAVYIVLPNSLHAEYTIRSAQAHKHVLCEKPMATSVIEAQRMIKACSENGVKLMIAYRCQYEPFNRRVIQEVSSRSLGQIRFVEACNVQDMKADGQWRLKKSLSGGGSLPDVGLYCLNSTRALLGEEPFEVSATILNPPGDARFVEVEDLINFTLKFPSGVLANCISSYSSHQSRRLRVYGSEANLSLEHAFDYQGQQLTLTRSNQGIEMEERYMVTPKNHFALELDHMADCIQHNITPYTPGEEGMQDHRIMEAIYTSAKTGRPITIETMNLVTHGPTPV